MEEALTLFEVGGLISRLGHSLGCEVFSQFPPTYRAARAGKTIDYVWSLPAKTPRPGARRWIAVAAFECEGIDVPDPSLEHDVDRLVDVAGGEPLPRVVVLYRTCEDGSLFWGPGRDPKRREAALVASANARLKRLCEGRADPIPAILDAEFVNTGPAVQRLIDEAQTRLSTLADRVIR